MLDDCVGPLLNHGLSSYPTPASIRCSWSNDIVSCTGFPKDKIDEFGCALRENALRVYPSSTLVVNVFSTSKRDGSMIYQAISHSPTAFGLPTRIPEVSNRRC